MDAFELVEMPPDDPLIQEWMSENSNCHIYIENSETADSGSEPVE